MAPLSDHLRESGSHARLPFHHDCPVCRAERLSGSLGQKPLVGRRSQAALLATTLAVSGLGPSSAALAEGGGNGGLAAQTPDGELDRVDADDGTQPDTPAAEDDAPIEGENEFEPDPDDGQEAPDPTLPTELAPEQPGDEAEPIADPAPEPRTAPAPPANPAPEPAPVPAQPPPAPPPVPQATAPPAPIAALEDPGAAEAPPQVHRLRLHIDLARSATRPTDAAAPPAASPTPATLDAQAGPAAEATPVASAQRALPATNPARPSRHSVEGDRYTTRPGDSLWSIARRLLGTDAPAARIAGEVDRLWELNHERIATGDPDLLPVGVEVRL